MRAALANQPVVPLPGADPTVARGIKGGLQNTPPAPAPGQGLGDLLQNLGQQIFPGTGGQPQGGGTPLGQPGTDQSGQNQGQPQQPQNGAEPGSGRGDQPAAH